MQVCGSQAYVWQWLWLLRQRAWGLLLYPTASVFKRTYIPVDLIVSIIIIIIIIIIVIITIVNVIKIMQPQMHCAGS